VQAIIFAWHERQVTRHLAHLARVRDQAAGSGKQLEAVLDAYALIVLDYHGNKLAALVHRGDHGTSAEQRLRDFIRDLLTGDAVAATLRSDVPPDELATYCLHALAAARSLSSKAAIRRLVAVILAGLRPGI
jgi:hypothetical protein